MSGQIFVSHSYTEIDNQFAQRFVGDLRARLGMDNKAILYALDRDPDPYVDRRVRAEIDECPIFLVLLSPDAVASAYVTAEIEYALMSQRSGPASKRIIPVLTRPCEVPPRLLPIRRYSFLDRPYDQALAALLIELIEVLRSINGLPQPVTSQRRKPIKIFVSYRRTDTSAECGRIYDRLAEAYGRSNIFKDVDAMPLGLDFRPILTAEVAKCEIMLAIIGRGWESAVDAHGLRRLESPNDYVRIEIAEGLARGIPVIPVLVQNSLIPQVQNLPELLVPLVYRTGIAIRDDPYFHSDMDLLIDRLDSVAALSSRTERQT